MLKNKQTKTRTTDYKLCNRESDFTFDSDQVQQYKKTVQPITGVAQRKKRRLSYWDSEERVLKEKKV